MATNKKCLEIPNRLKSIKGGSDPDMAHIVAGADDIYDDAKGKKQSVINAEVDETIGDDNTAGTIKGRIKTAEGKLDTLNGDSSTSGSVAKAVADAKTELIGGATSNGNTLKKVEDRTVILETAVGSNGSVDQRIAAAKSEVIGDAASDYNTLGKLEDKIQAEASRAEGAESNLNSGKADKATTLAGYGITDAYTKSETYTKTEVNGLVDTPHQEYETVDAYANLPAPGSKDTIYRVSNYNGSTSQVDASVYSEYAWDGTQYVFLCVKSQIGEVFDISVYNNNAKYADLAAALNGGANIPQSLQKGGMSVKFVQSSDNKYVQYRLMADEWSTTVGDWQGVDDEPTAGSENMVKSGGVADAEKYNNYKCSAIESAIIGAKNIKAYNVNGWLGQESNVINMTSSDSKTLILSVVPGDVIECTQSNGILIAFIKDFTLARTYPVVRSSEYPQSLRDPAYAVVPSDAKYCFISYKYYDTAQRGIEYVKYNGTYLSYNGIDLRELESDVKKLSNGEFDIIKTLGDSRTKTTFGGPQMTALLCPISGNITNATIHVGESASAELRIYKAVDDTTLIATYPILLEAGVNNVTLDITVTKGNMVFIKDAKLTYNVYQGEDSNFYNYSSSGFALRTDHVRFELSFTVSNNIELSDVDYDLDILKDGDFSSSESIGDSTTASAFNSTKDTGLLCTNNGVINNARIHVGEAGVATIEVYKSVNEAILLSTKTVSLEAGVNYLSELNIAVNKGNIIYISGVKLTYRVPESLDNIFYSKRVTGFVLRSDTVRFEVAYTIDISVNVFQLEKGLESKADIVTIYPEQYITITPGNDNYNLIRNAIASISDASETKHYTIIVPEGEYVECDLQGKKYVTIKGENRDRVIIRNDGTSTKTTPSDYFWEDYANTPLNEIPRSYKHIIAPKNDIAIENCTLIANECKYVVHGENSGWYKAVFQNCKLVASNCNNTIGLGLRHIQKIEFINCHIVSEAGVLGIMYYHNWTWQQTTGAGFPLYGGGSNAEFHGCLLEINGASFVLLDELASRNEDITLFNCCHLIYPENVIPVITFGVNSSDGHSTAKDLNGNYYTDLEDVPYCMRLIAVKSGFAGMSIEKHDRSLAEDYVQIVD